LWLYFALLFDGLVLFLLFQLAEYPIEKMMVGITATSPIDLARILILLQVRCFSYVGLYRRYIQRLFWHNNRIGYCSQLAYLAWIVVPFIFSLQIFKRKDL
jgi:Cu-processing system permease protein